MGKGCKTNKEKWSECRIFVRYPEQMGPARRLKSKGWIILKRILDK
jgi:hypothetical protein